MTTFYMRGTLIFEVIKILMSFLADNCCIKRKTKDFYKNEICNIVT